MSLKKNKAKKLLQSGTQKLQSGLFYESIEDLKKAINLNKTLDKAYYNLGVAYYNVGKVKEAVSVLKQFLFFDAKSSEGHYLYGWLLYSRGDVNKSIEHFSNAIKFNPENIEAASGLAKAYHYIGDYDESYKIISRVVNQKKLNVNIAHIFSRLCNKIDKCDEAEEYIKYITSAVSTLPIQQKNIANYFLGDILDERKEYKLAFEAYKKANDSRDLKYNQYAFDDLKHKIVTNLTKDTFGKDSSSSNISSLPVFLVGMPRSGTSLIEQILSSHSQVHGSGESNEIRDIVHDFTNGNDAIYVDALKNLTVDELNRYSENYIKSQKALIDDAKYITDKMPHNYIHLGLIAKLFPGCKVIHCKRNKLDTLLSIYFQNFTDTHTYATNLKHIAHHYDFYSELMEHWKSVLPIDILEINYEDVVSDLKGTTVKMLDYIGLQWEDSCNDFYKSSRHVFTASQDQVNRPIYNSSVERWKNYSEQIQGLL